MKGKSEEQEFYRTSDMGLVTYLRIEGHEPQGTVKDGDQVYWVFIFSEGLRDTVDRFASSEARVDPKMFNREYARAKKELFNARQDREASSRSGR